MASLPSTDPIGAEDVRAHLNRVLNSEAFRKAPSLRHLLEYVVDEWARGHSQQIKESVIAIEVFGRRADFDGRIDNIVRVQAHRLRKLLETYYAEEGKRDRLRLSIPKGSYVPQVHLPEEQEPGPEAEVAVLAPVENPISSLPLFSSPLQVRPEPSPPERLHSRSSLYRTLSTYAGVFLAGAFLAVLTPLRFMLLPGHPGLDAGSWRESQPDASVAEIWKGIFEPGVDSIISFTSPVFLRVGRSQAFLLYHGPLRAPEGTEMNVAAEDDPYVDRQFTSKGEPLFFSDGWSGTGEVLAMNRLTILASQLRHSPTVVPSRALTLREAQGADVIFLGSPSMNGTIARIGTDSAPIYDTEDGRIIVRRPATGESAFYENIVDPATKELKTCYALFSVLPGAGDRHKIASSAGLGSQATWAAIEFLSTPQGASQLARELRAGNAGKLPRYYQTVVRSDIIDGSMTNQSLMSTHVVKP